jgi:hypothetical protein
VLVLSQLLDCRQQALSQQLDADHLVHLQTGAWSTIGSIIKAVNNECPLCTTLRCRGVDKGRAAQLCCLHHPARCQRPTAGSKPCTADSLTAGLIGLLAAVCRTLSCDKECNDQECNGAAAAAICTGAAPDPAC